MRAKGAKRLLILDGYESYHFIKFEEYYKANGIITLYMPAYSSYRLQPFNVFYFSVLKRFYTGFIEDLMRRY